MQQFDLIGFQKYISGRIELYALSQIGKLSANNPNWLENLKKELTNEDGTPINITEEESKKKVMEILNHPEWKTVEFNMDSAYELLEITKETLDKFIIEQ